MHVPLAICKQFCEEDVVKFLCLCPYESVRGGIEVRPIDFIERP